MYRLNRIELKSHDGGFFDELYELHADIELQKILLGSYRVEDIDLPSWISRRKKDPYYREIIFDGRKFIGYVQIIDHHVNNKTGYLGICLRENYRNQGFGMKTFSLLIEDVKQKLGLRKIKIKVRVDNPAVCFYERLGFLRIGKMRHEYFDGERYWDVYIYEKFI